MSDDDTPQEDKTEEASQRRLDQAREEGKTALSKDGVSAATLITGTVLAVLTLPGVIMGQVGLVRRMANAMADIDTQALPPWGTVIMDCLMAGAPLLGVLVGTSLAGVLAGLAQTGGAFFPTLLEPDPSRLWSTEPVTKAFTRQGIVDTSLSIVRAMAVGGVSLHALLSHREMLVGALRASSATTLMETADLLSSVALRGAGVLVVLGAIDVFLTRRRFFEKMKMTKDEIKREMKEDEGDPHIRGARKRRHRELRRGAIAAEVPKADAVVVNPTHIAVVLRYRKKSDKAPRITAKGKGPKADAIRRLAIENGIPIVKDIPLARLLHARVRIGREVPAETYRAVAAVLAFVAKVTGRPPGTGPE